MQLFSRQALIAMVGSYYLFNYFTINVLERSFQIKGQRIIDGFFGLLLLDVKGFFPGQDLFGNKVYRPMQVDVDEPTLQKIATTTHARYFRATDTPTLREIYAEIDRSEKTEFEAPEYLDYRELYPWLVWPALALVLFEIGLGETVLRKLP